MANPEHDQIFRDALRKSDSSVSLAGLDLRKNSMGRSRLNDFDLSNSDFRDSDFEGAFLQNANLSKCNLARVNLPYGDLRNANLTKAKLIKATLRDAKLQSANLTGANLTDANLIRAQLEDACLIDANLTRTDFRGAKGITAAQLASAKNADKAVLDEQTLVALGLPVDLNTSRHGIQRKKPRKASADFLLEVKPSFGDLFLICGYEHPEFAATGDFGFEEIASLGIEQVDDYFAFCKDGDPVVWIFPLVRGNVVAHHPGPFDGFRVELDHGRKAFWGKCVSEIASRLTVPFKQILST